MERGDSSMWGSSLQGDLAPRPVRLRTVIVIGTIIAATFCWFLPSLFTWIRAHQAPIVQTSAPESAEAERARRYAAVIAACFNGQAITDGVHVVDCRPRR